MNIFVAGSTGVIGQLLLPKLVQAGHEVVGMTHNPQRKEFIESWGARGVVADAFDREGMIAVIEDIRPDVVIHQLTSLSEWNLEDNARIRMEGTRHLVEAAQAAGVKRMIAQSISWAYEPGDYPATEEVSLDIHAPAPRKSTIDGIVSLEHAVAQLPNHVILRYGMLYGPNTWYDAKGSVAEKVVHRALPSTDGVTSFLHVEDAANAALLALDWPIGPVNIVDDEPAAGTLWLPVYADALQAPTPEYQAGSHRGERGASNAKARKEYGWEPLYPTWRSGFAHALE
ncbi:NAD-dependent epimerase/dehydratase family protein [Paenibacillus glucanolyticus]|uniref:NAD-dependent epimerase/dehydratase family protein n=1 Tax=Paenibacillus glucanolyticus TaxID=59843 RepID=UPI00096D111D|nr:NAD(P)-dependent oxidoreductase [Paenibacillus glucanolyticus]OMF74496.1 dTDP-glucose 4,6-dehydratase [Paenibacillus glucanolyticus]